MKFVISLDLLVLDALGKVMRKNIVVNLGLVMGSLKGVDRGKVIRYYHEGCMWTEYVGMRTLSSGYWHGYNLVYSS